MGMERSVVNYAGVGRLVLIAINNFQEAENKRKGWR